MAIWVLVFAALTCEVFFLLSPAREAPEAIVSIRAVIALAVRVFI
jgi:hypothetical protein